MSGLPSRRHTSDFIDPALLVDSRSPNDVAVFLDNYYGCQFKLLNDIKIHRSSGNFLFNDVEWVSLRLSKTLLSYICFSSYGFLNRFRPEPLMPNQVYRLDPVTRRVRVVATDFNKCNGIALSEDGKLAYMYEFQFLIHIFKLTSRLRTIRTDTAASSGFLGKNQTFPATMQVYSIVSIILFI
jgi:gluconolactonase